MCVMNERDKVDEKVVQWNHGYEKGYAQGVKDERFEWREVVYGKQHTLLRTIFDGVFAVAAVIFLAILVADWAGAAPPKPDEKPITKPAIGIDLTCQPIDMAPADAATAGAEDAVAWAKWVDATAEGNQRKMAALIERRMARLGYFVGVADAASLGEVRRAYLGGYVLAVKGLFDGDLPDYAMQAFKTGVARAEAKIAHNGFECVGV